MAYNSRVQNKWLTKSHNVKWTIWKFNLFHCTTGHVQIIYLTYTLIIKIMPAWGQKTRLIETPYRTDQKSEYHLLCKFVKLQYYTLYRIQAKHDRAYDFWPENCYKGWSNSTSKTHILPWHGLPTVGHIFKNICDPSGEKGPSGGWCHNVRNDVINVGNFPGKTDIHVVIFYDFQMRSITLWRHL